jgi:hypothetical protein
VVLYEPEREVSPPANPSMAKPDPGMLPEVTVGEGTEAEEAGAMAPLMPWADTRAVLPKERARAAISPARRKEEYRDIV